MEEIQGLPPTASPPPTRSITKDHSLPQASLADIRQFDPLATPSPKRQSPPSSSTRRQFEITVEPLIEPKLLRGSPSDLSPTITSSINEIETIEIKVDNRRTENRKKENSAVIKNGRFYIQYCSKENRSPRAEKNEEKYDNVFVVNNDDDNDDDDDDDMFVHRKTRKRRFSIDVVHKAKQNEMDSIFENEVDEEPSLLLAHELFNESNNNSNIKIETDEHDMKLDLDATKTEKNRFNIEIEHRNDKPEIRSNDLIELLY